MREFFKVGDRTLISLNEFIKYARGISATVNDFLARYPVFEEDKYSSLLELISNEWDNVPKLEVKDALALLDVDENLSRDAFLHIDIPTIYNSIEDKKIVHTYEDSKVGKYVLWEADLTEIGFSEEYTVTRVLQMWCPSTGQEYWVLVHIDLNKANEAVAWMCRTWFSPEETKAIYRQGEVVHIYCHEDKVPEMTDQEWEEFKRKRQDKGYPRHIPWEEYREKLVIQT